MLPDNNNIVDRCIELTEQVKALEAENLNLKEIMKNLTISAEPQGKATNYNSTSYLQMINQSKLALGPVKPRPRGGSVPRTGPSSGHSSIIHKSTRTSSIADDGGTFPKQSSFISAEKRLSTTFYNHNDTIKSNQATPSSKNSIMNPRFPVKLRHQRSPSPISRMTKPNFNQSFI